MAHSGPAADLQPIRLISGFVTVGFWTFLSRIFGFARDILIAAFLGSGPVAEAFLIVVLLAQRRRRARAETALRTSEALRDGILASLPGTMAVVDRSGTVVEVNRAWRRLAAPDRAADGTSVRVRIENLRVSRERDPVARQVLDGIDAVLTGQQTEFHLEYPIGTPEAERWVSVTVSPLKRPEGGAVILYLDITSRKRAEMEAEHLRRDLTYLSRVNTMGQLTASLAHELIQPLTAIVSNAQAGERYLAADPRRSTTSASCWPT